MKIARFEDIEAWKSGSVLTQSVSEACCGRKFSRDFGLVDPVRRAAVSLTSDIAESFERGGDREIIQALTDAKGSCGEVRSRLYAALDEQYISQTDSDGLTEQALAVSRPIGGFLKYLQTSRLRGSKFKRRDEA